MQKTSIIMTVFSNHLEYMKASIDSIRRYTEKGTYEIIVVVSGGYIDTTGWLSEATDIRSLFFEQEISLSQAWNEGINSATGDFMLFIHEDTLVTEGWLSLLLKELNLKNDIGLVGPLTNNADDDQSESVNFSSIEDLLSFSKQISLNRSVEERLVLAGFCFLVKSSVINSIGLFDEQLDGKTLITDYCLRVGKLGWKLILCRHVYVHYYGVSERETEEVYEQRFIQKWGYAAHNAKIEFNAIRQIKKSKEDIFTLLVLGSNFNATALKISQVFTNAHVYYGGSQIINKDGNLESGLYRTYRTEDISPISDLKFDYIILSSMAPELLSLAFELLNDQGKLIVEMRNIHYFGVVRNLLSGQGLEADMQYWKLADITSMFEETGFKELDIDYIFNDSLQEHDHSFIFGLGNLVGQLPQEFEISSFLVTAHKALKDDLLHSLFTELLHNPTEEILSEVFLKPTTQIIASLERYDGFAVPLLNYLGISNFERGNMEDVLPYLTTAYENEPANSLTLINFAKVMKFLGEDEAALNWLNRIEDKNEQVENWINVMQQDITDKKHTKNKLKFLMRRVENNVERDGAIEEILYLVKKEYATASIIIDSVLLNIIDKTGTLNRIATSCFNMRLYEVVIPLLEKSYSLDSENEDTLYNLGYILYKFGAIQEALSFLIQIREPDEDTKELQQEIEESIKHERV